MVYIPEWAKPGYTRVDTVGGDIDEALLVAKTTVLSGGDSESAVAKVSRKGATSDVSPRDRIAEEMYDAISVADLTSVRIPLVYGQVYHKGTMVDSGETVNVEDDRYNDRTLRFVMSEGPCEGIAVPIKNHIVINDTPLENPSNFEITKAGVKVKEVTTRTTYTTKTSAASFGINNSILTDASKIHPSLLRNSVAGLDDVAIDQQLKKGHVLHYNSDIERWQSVHLNEMLKDSGAFISEQVSEVALTYPQSTWFLPHTTLLNVTWKENASFAQRDGNEGPHRWWRSNILGGALDDAIPVVSETIDEQVNYSVKLNGIKHPDIVVYRGVTYQFIIDTDFWDTTNNPGGGSVNTKFYIAEAPVRESDPEVAGQAQYTNGMATGNLATLTITNTPAGYTAGEEPAVTITRHGSDSTGTGATAHAVSDGTTMILTITNIGSAYTHAPTIAIAAPGAGGTTATASATISAYYADATLSIIWTVGSGTPDWLWYGVNNEKVSNPYVSWGTTGARIQVKDIGEV